MSDYVERLGRLTPEEKVNMAIEMSEVCVHLCAEGIKVRYPGVSEEELLEKLRERIAWTKRFRRHGFGGR
ncbi:MAG: hypothetical protein ACLFU9_04275 [Candidatus Bathyarchaeia archaeon]